MSHLTMQELEDLGFKIVKSYLHDNFTTQRRKKGIIEIETTWDLSTGNFETQDLSLTENYIEKFTTNELIVLDLILNKL